mgnify:CR=1 FL=1|tara:strand:+ start:236 stop:472 length:237 start_codon:yes stop_codon:yes gene_type:complete
MKKILFSFVILVFSSVVMAAEDQKCRELKIGPEYFKCLKSKIGLGSNSSSDTSDEIVTKKDNRSWYQKIKEGKPLFSK